MAAVRAKSQLSDTGLPAPFLKPRKVVEGQENSLFTLHRVRKLKHSTQAHKMVVYITHEIIINKINNLYHHLSVPISCLDHTALKWKMR